ncbi:ribonucleotide reductase subunit alpha [Piscinibacter sakaiensis]|uniref:ribonucleotide reductase subunit alpha n=1 Tax=Piscinibacter sakaiensis TaxID=1547922 RepID=UPI003AAB8CEF
MTISSFDDLLRSAGNQQEPQRLLFVFARAGLPDDASAEQRERFEAGEGGTLTPLMCVDKLPAELDSFETLLSESLQFEQPWDIVFVAAMSGTNGISPTAEQAEAALQSVVEAIRTGRIGAFIPFDHQGRTVQFS